MGKYLEKRLLSVNDAAKYLSIGRTLLYQWAKNDKIPSIRINKRRLFDVNELDKFIDSLKVDSAK